jgi:hypothetical protein
MKKELYNYINYLETRKRELSPEEYALLADEYRQKVAEFQHERLVHLIVTLAFAFITILLFLITLFLTSDFAACLVGNGTDTGIGIGNLTGTGSGTALVIGFAAATLVFVVTDVFYIMHYYHLENGVQRLYRLNPCDR